MIYIVAEDQENLPETKRDLVVNRIIIQEMAEYCLGLDTIFFQSTCKVLSR